MDLASFLETATPRTDEVTVCARGDLVARHAELTQQLEQQAAEGRSLGGNSEANALAEQIVAVEAEMAESELTIPVQTIGGEWGELIAQHPPRKEDKGADHNRSTFPVAAVAACCVPPITVEDAARLRWNLVDGEWNRLWLTVYAMNTMALPRPKLVAATALLQANERSSGTPAAPASPGPSSLAGSGDPSPITTTDQET